MAREYLSTSRRHRPSRSVPALAGAAAVIVFLLVWWLSGSDKAGPDRIGSVGEQMAEADGQASRDTGPAAPGQPLERGARAVRREGIPPVDRAQRISAAVQAGQRALEKDDVLTAQVQMTAALRAGATGEQAAELRAKLVQLANKVVFSPARVSGDPHSSTYIVQRGETLRKIAKQHKITADLIARTNSLANKSMIREGARLKVTRGPFHAVVYKRRHALDVFLDDILVRTYKVGLGEHNSTPTGTWRVKNKLTNPTYFPPRGGKIVQADDPNNPLGEHWIGLEGVAGEAKKLVRYGIHGTNDPDSVGRDMSLGCIRLHNEDVAELYMMLVVGDSQVLVKE